MSDLHLEAQAFEAPLPRGDVLIVAGDLCHARCLDPARTDRYSTEQRGRVMRFVERAAAAFAHVLLVSGNHEPRDGVLEETPGLIRRHLAGVTLLDDASVEIGGVRFFGTTLWTDFDGGSEDAMNAVRRRMGEFFFVKTRRGDGTLARFQPEDALGAHRASWARLMGELARPDARPTVVISHHAPSRAGLDRRFAGNGLDSAYASDLDAALAAFERVPVWVHGHTHVARTYRVGGTTVRSNALGFAARGQGARGFTVDASFQM